VAKHTIILKSFVDNYEEQLANAAVVPGMLIERMSTGKVRAHATADGAAHSMFAVEDELRGREIDIAYAADSPVHFKHCISGEVVYAILANDESVAIGDKLVSNGAGFLKKREGASDAEVPGSIQATALETLDLSDDSSAESSGPVMGKNRHLEVEIF